MMKLEIRPVMPSDYPAIERMKLRECDYNEIKASDPNKTVKQMVGVCARLPNTVVATLDGEVMGMCGSVPLPDNPKFGIIWSFATDASYPHMKYLTSYAKARIKEWLKMYPAGIGNYIDTRNKINIKWLKRLDFKFMDQEVDMGCGVPFTFFVRYPDV